MGILLGRRKLPGTVEITLDLREPAAVVLHGEKYVLIDEEGVVLEIRDTLPHYTVFDLLTVEEAEEGEVIVVKEKEKYDKYQELLGYMQDADLYFRRFVMDDSGIIRLYVKSELKCEGTEENLVAGMKDGNLKAVLYNLSESGYEKGVVTVGDDQYYSYSKTFK